ncbi:hypothetical protein ACTMU2_31980 [Cupriavidus basilensis]
MAESNTVFISSAVDKSGDQYNSAILTPADGQREKIVLAKPYVIPVLFLPGIMGTNLRRSDSKKVVWRPPNLDMQGAMESVEQLFQGRNAADVVAILSQAPGGLSCCPLPTTTVGNPGYGCVTRGPACGHSGPTASRQ